MVFAGFDFVSRVERFDVGHHRGEDCLDIFQAEGSTLTLSPNTSLEPTPVTPVCFRCGFRVGGSHRRRGSVLGR